MTIVALVPLVVALVGAALYVVSSHPKAAELGRLAFAAGLIGFCIALSHTSIRLP